jgi:hypothetical protein
VSKDWIATDGRVRGGKFEVGNASDSYGESIHGHWNFRADQTQLYLTCTESTARFDGHLDIKTLGGAGFVSQRTTELDREWNLDDYDGIQLLAY